MFGLLLVGMTYRIWCTEAVMRSPSLIPTLVGISMSDSYYYFYYKLELLTVLRSLTLI